MRSRQRCLALSGFSIERKSDRTSTISTITIQVFKSMNSLNQPASLYRNAMELLAIEEIEQQLQKLPQNITESINKTEAIAYALNRLPPLYATTFEGYFWQQTQARETLKDLISKAASWGIKAAQRKKEFRYYGDTTRLMSRYANTN